MRLLSAVVTIAVLSAIIIGTSGAFFQDRETSSNNLLQASSLDLLVNGQNNPSTLVDLTNLQPGEREHVDKTLLISDQPGNIYLQLNSLASSQGTNTSQEIDEEANTWGGPKFDLENYIHVDLLLNNQPIIDPTASITLNQIVDCWIPVGSIEGGIDTTMLQGFTLNGQVTNWAHGDELTFTEQFLAVQTDVVTAPLSDSGKIWDQATLSCITPSITPSPTTVTYVSTISFNTPEPVNSFDFYVTTDLGTITDVTCIEPSGGFSIPGEPNRCILAKTGEGITSGELATVTIQGTQGTLPQLLITGKISNGAGEIFDNTHFSASSPVEQ